MRTARRNPQPSDAAAYLAVLAHLRALQWLAWTAHWQSKGPNFYGMHLLLERLYTGKGEDFSGPNIEEQTDELGERIIAHFGNSSINPIQLNNQMTELLKVAATSSTDPACQLLCLERSLQQAIKVAWDLEQQAGSNRSLGLDDYLMGLANDRETAIYLLQQVWRG